MFKEGFGKRKKPPGGTAARGEIFFPVSDGRTFPDVGNMLGTMDIPAELRVLIQEQLRHYQDLVSGMGALNTSQDADNAFAVRQHLAGMLASVGITLSDKDLLPVPTRKE